jgi:hypothetical protein
MNCHVYLSARKKVKKIKNEKKNLHKKNYHSINLFIFDFSIFSKRQEIQAKTLSLPRQIDENF